MRNSNIHWVGIVVACGGALGGAAGVAGAADYVNTFDTTAAPFRYDYGGTGTPTVTFDATHDAGGSSTSGSAKFTQTFNGTATGVAFTADALYPATTVYNVSFDLYVDPSSARGAANYGAGYFEFLTRQTDNYNSSASLYNENLGNPSYAATTQYGVWEHISVPLSPTGAGANVRALTIQDYNNDAINGTVTYYVDNLVLQTSPASTPEPATALLGLATLGLLRRGRRT